MQYYLNIRMCTYIIMRHPVYLALANYTYTAHDIPFNPRTSAKHWLYHMSQLDETST